MNCNLFADLRSCLQFEKSVICKIQYREAQSKELGLYSVPLFPKALPLSRAEAAEPHSTSGIWDSACFEPGKTIKNVYTTFAWYAAGLGPLYAWLAWSFVLVSPLFSSLLAEVEGLTIAPSFPLHLSEASMFSLLGKISPVLS